MDDVSKIVNNGQGKCRRTAGRGAGPEGCLCIHPFQARNALDQNALMAGRQKYMEIILAQRPAAGNNLRFLHTEMHALARWAVFWPFGVCPLLYWGNMCVYIRAGKRPQNPPRLEALGGRFFQCRNDCCCQLPALTFCAPEMAANAANFSARRGQRRLFI